MMDDQRKSSFTGLFSRHIPSPGRPTAIPISDPKAALQFCQELVAYLENGSGLDGLPAVSINLEDQGVASEAPTLEPPELSIVLPVYDEEANLPLLYERITAVLAGLNLTYEIIFVDDGSQDNGPAWLHSLTDSDPQVILVELARNFGHQVAISAGLDYAQGRGVIIMDADLQDPPELLPDFIQKWQEGYDVVYAVRAHRKESRLLRLAYSIFYRLLRVVSSIEIPLDAGDFCIMDRKVVDVLVRMPERNRFLRGIRSWVGLNQIGLVYARDSRHAGKAKYTINRLVYLALDGLVSFSYIPLRVITFLGFGVSLMSLILAIFYTVKKLTTGLSPPGFATLVVSIFFLAGIQLVTIGVIGEYVGRIFEEVKRRPLYVVRSVKGLQNT
jgi:dolichol-phosphate mannosyltransferase